MFKKKYYFIASVRVYKEKWPEGTKNYKGEDAGGKEYEQHESRCWGFYTSKKKAIKAVEENWTDMNEAGYYPYVVIESATEGLLTVVNNPEDTIWFKAIYKDKEFIKYEITEQPEFAKGFVGWTI
jgi:hypothetical protein